MTTTGIVFVSLLFIIIIMGVIIMGQAETIKFQNKAISKREDLK